MPNRGWRGTKSTANNKQPHLPEAIVRQNHRGTIVGVRIVCMQAQFPVYNKGLIVVSAPIAALRILHILGRCQSGFVFPLIVRAILVFITRCQ